MNKSINSLQFLRVVAAWMVVFHHFVQIFFKGPSFGNSFNLFFHRYGSLGVDIFFIISGFIIYTSTLHKHNSAKEFFVNRIARIVPAYWFVTAITCLLVLSVKGLIPLTEVEPIFLFKSLLFLPAQNPSGLGFYPLVTVGWTLNYEAVFYLIFGVSLFFLPNYRFFVIALGLFLLKIGARTLGGDFGFYANSIIFEFVIGIIIALIYATNRVKIPLILAFSVILGCVYSIGYTVEYNHYRYLSIGLPIGLIVTMLLSQEHYFKLPKLLKWLSDWSYSTYLVHVIVLSVGYKIVQLYGLNPYLILLCCCCVIILFSGLSYSLLERPALIFIKYWGQNNRSQSTRYLTYH